MSLHLSVLKNRLLQRTNRQFHEANYGAKTIRDLLERFPDLFALQHDARSVRILVGPAQKGTSTSVPAVRPSGEASADFQDALDQHRATGDSTGAGEAYASQLSSVPNAEIERIFVNVVTHWASSSPFDLAVHTIKDLIAIIGRFIDSQLALAVVHATLRMQDAKREPPAQAGDLTFRVAEPIRDLFRIPNKTKPADALYTAILKTRGALSALQEAVKNFCTSTVVTAKPRALEMIKRAHTYEHYALAGERQILRDLEVLLGVPFRRFCETCERYESATTPQRARDLRHQLQGHLATPPRSKDHRLMHTVWGPVVTHVSGLIEQGTLESDRMTTPNVKIIGGTFKVDLDLARLEEGVPFLAHIANEGGGRAAAIQVATAARGEAPSLLMSDPPSPFDLAPHTERLVQLRLAKYLPKYRNLDVTLICQTVTERRVEARQSLLFEKQLAQPDWDHLRRNPPYSINPIRERDRLYGRDAILDDLELQVWGETSMFLWGQKRVGKTSVLQVLANSLQATHEMACVVFKIGQLVSAGEGQMAHTIATRLVEALDVDYRIPKEEEFGAVLGKRLLPIVDELKRQTGKRMLVIIDEFDDLPTAYYLGERGKQFMMALRSLSETGLTFMFVGSERMSSIFSIHSSTLNKWVNRSLDRIADKVQCEALITEPVAGQIEYDREAVESIVDYCCGNPFYMQLIARRLFERCVQEQRTFVGKGDVEYVHRTVLVGELGAMNFAHFWEDAPVLEPEKRLGVVADNCYFLACLSVLGASYESIDDLVEAGEQHLGAQDRLSRRRLDEVQAELARRGVLRKGESVTVELPIFRDWLIRRGADELTHAGRSFSATARGKTHGDARGSARVVEMATFPIGEDDLLAVSDRLVYFGKQKDVAEVRRWLAQFDDDGRIEIAFLLLKRLVEKGFVNEGARVNARSKMEDAINARRRDVGDGVWRVQPRGRRLDNLYICHVDKGTGSGAATARELKKRMNPGKCGGVEELDAWLQGHMSSDPMIVVVDDFAGTGRTLTDGLEKLWALDKGRYASAAREGRITCCLETAFPEAVERIKARFADVHFLVMTDFGDEVRGLAPTSGIFSSVAEREFATDVMTQIGNDLMRGNPLGFGNMGALVAFPNTVPNNTLPVFWATGTVNGREWRPLLPRGGS